MKRRILSVISILLIVALITTNTDVLGSFFRPKTAFAVGDLTVNWGVPEGSPIFTLSNIAPGHTESHTVSVTNGATVARTVGIRGIMTQDASNMRSVMTITISRDGSDIYGGTTGQKTLAQFFTESTLPSFINLGSLNPSESETYTITVKFLESADNQFQNKTITFDLKLGINDETTPTACQNMQFGNTVFGTQKADVLQGTSGNDLIIALEGNDVINSGGGDDCIVGGAGTNVLNTGNGDDIVIGGSNIDSVQAGNGNDTVFAGGGNDTVNGENGNDTLSGEDGRDTIVGGNGNDMIDGGADRDVATGNAGTDTCIAELKSTCEI
jgi:Ca2+-binding RTX toxin-like protein